MRAGSLDRRIRIETKVPGPRSASGQPSGTWVLQAEPWAEVLDHRGREQFASNAFAAQSDLVLEIRYPEALTPLPSASENCRVLLEGRAYDILAALENPRRGRREAMLLFLKGRAEAAA